MIQAMEAQTQPNSINPVTIGTILRAINAIVDDANTTASRASQTALNASATADTALEHIDESQAAVNAQVLAQIQALLNSVNIRTQLTPTTYGGKRGFAYEDVAIPHFNNDIDFTAGYNTISVKIGGTTGTKLTVDKTTPGTVLTAILRCRGDTDMDKVMQASSYYNSMKLLSSKDLFTGHNYIMKIYKTIDTTTYSSFDPNKIEFLITINEL